MGSNTQRLTVKLRVRDNHAADLNRQARAVSFVWNYLNETQKKAMQDRRQWLSAFDLQKLTNGSAKYLDIHAHTIQRVCRVYEESRRRVAKPWLRWRGKRSLGWVPFNTETVKFNGDTFKFRGKLYRTMHLSPSRTALFRPERERSSYSTFLP